MEAAKKYLKSPYLYIFLISYYGVWLVWNNIKIPFTNPAGVISYLPSIHYNPENNILRFLLAVLVPPLLCVAYWAFTSTKVVPTYLKKKPVRYTLCAALVVGSILMSLAMGMVQGSVNPANNPPGAYGGPYSAAIVDTFHEGETLGPAISYEQKDLKPYRNFVVIHGVFQDPLRTVIAFKLFGKSIGAERAFSVILLMLTFLLYYCLLLVLFRGNLIKSALGLAILGALTLPTETLPAFLSQGIVGVQLPFRDIATIIFLMLAVVGLRAAIAARTKLLILYSVLIGFVMVVGYANSIDRAFYITALSACWLVMIFAMTDWRRFWQTTFIPFVIGCFAGLPILGLALKWDYIDLIRYLITISRYKEYLDGNIFTQPDLGMSIAMIGIGAFLTIGLFWVVKEIQAASALHRSFKATLKIKKEQLNTTLRVHYVPVLLFLTGAFYLRSAIGRADEGHFAYSVQWLYLLVAYVLIAFVFSRKKIQQVIAFTSIIIFGILFAFFAFQVKALDIGRDTFPIHQSDTLVVPSDYLQTAKYLKENLHGQDSFVTLTSEGIWYYLVNKPSPISYPVIWYAFTIPQRTLIANQIKDNPHIKYIVTNNNWTSDFDYVPNPVRFPEVYKVLYQYYAPKIGIGQQTVWERK